MAGRFSSHHARAVSFVLSGGWGLVLYLLFLQSQEPNGLEKLSPLTLDVTRLIVAVSLVDILNQHLGLVGAGHAPQSLVTWAANTHTVSVLFAVVPEVSTSRTAVVLAVSLALLGIARHLWQIALLSNKLPKEGPRVATLVTSLRRVIVRVFFPLAALCEVMLAWEAREVLLRDRRGLLLPARADLDQALSYYGLLSVFSIVYPLSVALLYGHAIAEVDRCAAIDERDADAERLEKVRADDAADAADAASFAARGRGARAPAPVARTGAARRATRRA